VLEYDLALDVDCFDECGHGFLERDFNFLSSIWWGA
jgi:hypothetical protein